MAQKLPAYTPPHTASIPPPSLAFASMEERILGYWDEIKAFETSLRLSAGRRPYTFLDGPPFATGLPHYGHILAGTIKDVICRYRAMSGHHVDRRFGWDTHGLPVEYEIDQKLGVKSPLDVTEKIGIARYNSECRAIVMRYSKEWEAVVSRAGRWISFERNYKTLDPSFMQSVWWVFGQLFRKGLVYSGTKVMPYSTACATPLSNFEANLNYKDVQDMTAIVSFPVRATTAAELAAQGVAAPDAVAAFRSVEARVGEARLLAWTTTPWTLPSNLALCVHPGLRYVKARRIATATATAATPGAPGEVYIVCDTLVESVFPPEKLAGKKDKPRPSHEVLDTFAGSDLVGLHYEPLFAYFADFARQHNGFRVLADDYVTADSGVGIVHQAPYFGEDDFRVCLAHGVVRKDGDVVCPVDDSGCFTAAVADFAGQYVKDADKGILRHLKAAGRLVSQSTYTHSYPFCWRSDTPLIYKAVPSWFVRVEDIKDRVVANNQRAAWVPRAIQDKRFHNWLVNARDWAVSRNRFWGCPIPVWQSADGAQTVAVSSIAELARLSGRPAESITDLHRESIDDITIPDPRGAPHPPLRRIAPVFDCWFESGSMPYASRGFPFAPEFQGFASDAERDAHFLRTFPADFVAEGLDQTRGWFYTLLILSTALFDAPPALHCVVNGLVLAENGQKMSKRLRNYPPVDEVFAEYGADAVRLYLANSPAVRAQDLRFRKDGVRDVVKDIFIPWYNAFRFLLQNTERYAQAAGAPFATYRVATIEADVKAAARHVMDMWILAATEALVGLVRAEMDAYRLYTVLPELVRFIDNLTNWYIRFNRERLKGDEGAADQRVCLNVLFFVLFTLCRLMACFTPFLTEFLYLEMRPLMRLDAPAGSGGAATGAAGAAEAHASIHFWPVPAIPRGTFAFAADPRVVEKVESLKSVVSLGRMVRRDRCNVTSFKMPLRTATVVHDDPDVVAGLRDLSGYIQSELNVLSIEFAVGAGAMAHLVVDPDFAAIREQYGADRVQLGSVIKAVKALCNLDDPSNVRLVTALRRDGRVTLGGHEITTALCKVRLEAVEAPGRAAGADDDGFLVLFDTHIDEDLVRLASERELFSKIQKLRKQAGLELTDSCRVYVTDVESGADIVRRALGGFRSRVRGTIYLGEPVANADASPSAEGCVETDAVRCKMCVVKDC